MHSSKTGSKSTEWTQKENTSHTTELIKSSKETKDGADMTNPISSKIRSVSEREFRIILPIRDNKQHELKREVYEPYMKKMSDEFGGVTIYKAFGCAREKPIHGEDNPLQCEENIVIESSFDTSDKRRIEKGLRVMNELGKKAQKKFGQWGVIVQSDVIEDVGMAHGDSVGSLPKKMRKENFDWFNP